ncbi:TIM barrel protein [Alkalibacter mobilis]|uniref:TIM barrel protein n=1 Tax=Alkalibacter mobilis TaxID=2787712 RepID=UPI0018A0FBCC|nr:TIM barrel protein [Alkalibacter mobilis]MBF7096885.1 sugar phosphate isomerase/epimerase [Alkalibacter mobilis]
MKVLMNMVKHESKLGWFDNNWEKFSKYLIENRLDGAELIFHRDYDVSDIPKDLAVGIHMTYWPTWLDFWYNNEVEMKRQFLDMKNVEMYYGSLDPQIMVDTFKNEFSVAEKLEMEYAVFHVSHVEVEHTFSWEFTYSDEEILSSTAELINRTFEETDSKIKLLFENLWWPGLNFTNPDVTSEFIEKVNYQHKGFMLDIGHLMITNPRLRDLNEAAEYILNILDKNKHNLKYFKGIHLNQALTGAYILQNHKEKIKDINCCDNYWDILSLAREHIGNIDMHIPFDDEIIDEIIKKVDPEYLVYEFLPKDVDTLSDMIKIQNKVLGR